MFELEKAIKEWKRSLRKNSGYEDGDIEELESHLRDRIDDLVEEGKTKQEAFTVAADEIGNVEEIATEFHKTTTTKPYLDTSSGIITLLPNYIKIAWRNLIFRKGYSAINIIGLSIAIASCILIALYVQNEFSYDTFHKNADRTYRILREFDIPDLQGTISYTPAGIGAASENIPGIETVVRIQTESPIVEYGSNKFVEPSFLLAEDGFFELFSYTLLQGESSLKEPNTVVITQEMAGKYFGDKNPIGENISVGNQEIEVVGVLADPPPNSHLQFDFVTALSNPDPSWGYNNYITYVMLRENQSVADITEQMSQLIQSNTDPDNQNAGNDFIPHLQPVTGIHLGQGVSVEIGSRGNIQYLYLFIALAVFIAILACINFMNLATARSMERAREVGMRKTLGGNRLQIALQFLGESIIMAIIAAIIAGSLSYFALPFLNQLAGTSIHSGNLLSFQNLLSLSLLTLFIGIISGGYPAIILSRFQPSKVLKGVFSSSEGSILRKGLVVFQFAISIALLAGTGIIYKQVHFMKSAGLGFNPDDVLVIKRVNFLGQDRQPFIDELAKIPGVELITSGFSIPGSFFINSMWQPDTPGAEPQNMDYSFVNFDYVETLSLEMIAGRSFSRSFERDSFAVLLNETAVEEFGWTPNEALNHHIVRGTTEYDIIGVVKNFNYKSLHANVYSLALFGPVRSPRYIAARVNSKADLPEIIEHVRAEWNTISSLPLEYSFLADDLKAQYETEDNLIRVFGIFAGLAIFIGCLGLLGLAAFMVAKRTKEIGVRKVLGASTTQILSLLSTDLLKLVLIGFVIAVPLAVYLMNKWLEGFAYKTEMSWWLFLATGIVAFAIALITVSSHALRAANMNPVNSLKSE